MHIELQCNGMTIACIDLLIRDKNVFVPMDITCPYPYLLIFFCIHKETHTYVLLPITMLMRVVDTHELLVPKKKYNICIKLW